MAQIATRNDGGSTSEPVRNQLDKTVDQATHATDELAARSTRAARRTLDAASATRDALAGEKDLLGLWQGTVREQVQVNVDTLRRLAAARGWREAVEVQTEYVQGTMSRMNDLMRCQVAVLGRLKLPA